MGRLDVVIVEAKNLNNPDWVGTADPYCELTVEGKEFKTDVVEDNVKNPQWNAVFKFQLADERSSQVHIKVLNDKVGKDDVLGVYSVSLAGLTKGVERDEWYLLKQCSGGANSEIRVKCLAVDFGDEPEGSAPPPPQVASSGAACWKCYLNRYADLQNAFGNNLGAAEQHYADNGKGEGRDNTCNGSCN